MENGSKALLMAGGILIAMLVIVLVVVVFNNIGSFYSSKGSSEASEQIAKFNLEYEAYNRDDVMGIELVSLLNKINNYNSQNDGTEISTNVKNLIEYDEDNKVDSEFKGKTFKCNKTTYDSSGRISGIFFVEN